MRPVAYQDTAKSVEMVARWQDPSRAALGSWRAAQYYGLPILKERVQDNQLNTTRFFCVAGGPQEVAEADKIEELLPPGVRPGSAELRDPTGVFERLNDPWRRRFRLVPYRAVGVEQGLLLALRLDNVQVGEEEQGPMLAALSPTPVSDGGGYQALIGGE